VGAALGVVLVAGGLVALAWRSSTGGHGPSVHDGPAKKPRARAAGFRLRSKAPPREKTTPPRVLFGDLAGPKNARCGEGIHSDIPIDDLAAGYAASNFRARLLKVLQRRYPAGAEIVQFLRDPSFFDRWFERGKTDWRAAMVELGTAVHESAHIAELAQRRGGNHVLILDKKTRWVFPIVASFHRSQIKDQLPPDLLRMSYAKTYLDGSSGAQGFEMLLEELHAYEHSLAVAIAVADQFPSNLTQSARDGLLTMMYYVELYLRTARRKHARVYQRLSRGEIARVVVRLFERARCLLRISSVHQKLGIQDELLHRHVLGAAALGEVKRLRSVH
jgi:hypothetical protein